MSCFTAVRDTAETAASLAGNYEVPGSSLITDKLVSKGAQKQLNSPLGEVAQFASGAAGSGVGSSFTGIPESAGGLLEDSALNSVSNSLGIGDTTDSLGITKNASGSTINPTTGGVTAGPSTPSSVTPSSGGGFSTPTNLADTFHSETQSLLDTGELGGGATSAATPALGSVTSPGNAGTFLTSNTGAAANSALGAAGVYQLGSTSGGLKDFLPTKSEVGSAVLKNAIPVAGLGYAALKGPSALPNDVKNLQSSGAVTAPLLALEQSNANEALTGQLSASQQASVTQMVQNAQNQLLQQLASSGVSDPTHDSRYISGMQEIQQRAMALQQSYIQQALGNATSTAGAAGTNISAVANEQIQLDKDYQDALAAAFAALGGTAGGGGLTINQRPAA